MIAEEMASGEKHSGETDDQGDFSIEGLPRDRMYEVRLKKRGILPAFVTLFLSGDKDLGTITLTSWASHHTSRQQSPSGRMRKEVSSDEMMILV